MTALVMLWLAIPVSAQPTPEQGEQQFLLDTYNTRLLGLPDVPISRDDCRLVCNAPGVISRDGTCTPFFTMPERPQAQQSIPVQSIDPEPLLACGFPRRDAACEGCCHASEVCKPVLGKLKAAKPLEIVNDAITTGSFAVELGTVKQTIGSKTVTNCTNKVVSSDHTVTVILEDFTSFRPKRPFFHFDFGPRDTISYTRTITFRELFTVSPEQPSTFKTPLITTTYETRTNQRKSKDYSWEDVVVPPGHAVELQVAWLSVEATENIFLDIDVDGPLEPNLSGKTRVSQALKDIGQSIEGVLRFSTHKEWAPQKVYKSNPQPIECMNDELMISENSTNRPLAIDSQD